MLHRILHLEEGIFLTVNGGSEFTVLQCVGDPDPEEPHVLGLPDPDPDPDPLVRGTDPAPDPSLSS